MLLCHLSDLHCSDIDPPEADVLLITGDMSYTGSFKEMSWFMAWLKGIRKNYRRVVWHCGNHERDLHLIPGICEEIAKETKSDYLLDSAVVIDGIKIWGSPYTPRFGPWGFMYDRGTLRWGMIHEDTDILMTHGPPLAVLDRCPDGQRVGCYDLFKRVEQVKPKYHLFGHIHDAYGEDKIFHANGKKTVFLNSSVCNEMYYPVNKPQVFEI